MSLREPGTFTGRNLTRKTQYSSLAEIAVRDVQVVRFEDVTPRYRRIVVAGDDLDDDFPFASFAPSDHVKVFFPHPESGELVSLRDTGDDEWVAVGGSTPPIYRDYTIRAWDPDRHELTLDFVLHDHGIGGRWARNAQVGDALVINGPSANQLLPESYSHYLAAGDETGLPSVSRVIAEAPAGARVTALIEVEDADDEQKLVGQDDHDVRWIHRSTAPVGEGHLSPLETALRALELPADTSDLFVFVTGETNSLKPIRRYLRRELGLTKDQVIVDGYWKRGVVNFDHHDTDLGTD